MRDLKMHFARKIPCDAKKDYQNECNKCGKIFRLKHNLKEHMQLVCGGETIRVECMICFADLKGKKSLGRHYRKVHEIEPPKDHKKN